MVFLYTAIDVINERIQNRENYRIANQGMLNYTAWIKSIDNDILVSLEQVKYLLEIAQDFLHSKYPYIVEGYSFSINRYKSIVNGVRNP